MNLIGQSINHRAFGSGVITDLKDGTVTICFQSSEKKFIYPDAFRDFLVFKDQKTQRHIEKEMRDRKTAVEKQWKIEQEERDRKRMMLTFKITPNSHAVFNLSPKQAGQAVQTWRVSTGTYLSGYSKGMPRIADRMKPNSVCLLTARPGGRDEKNRRIIGAFMVKEDFFGESACDGVIEGHPQYRLLASGENQGLFWDYVGQSAPPRWGNIAFKYCSGEVINQILADMVRHSEPGEQTRAAEEFYRYFCKTNRLQPLMKLEEKKAGANP